MPELTHDCGRTVRFPSGTEGKRGKCPHCGGRVEVPEADAVPRQKQLQLDPPPNWDAYVAYLEDRGPAPREFVMPSKLMLKTEADERWERRAQVRPSKFFCPSCKDRISIDQVLCTKCGLDFRTGRLMAGSGKLTAKGLKYLEQIPWLVEARKALAAEELLERKEAARGTLSDKAPRKKKKRSARSRRFK